MIWRKLDVEVFRCLPIVFIRFVRLMVEVCRIEAEGKKWSSNCLHSECIFDRYKNDFGWKYNLLLFLAELNADVAHEAGP